MDQSAPTLRSPPRASALPLQIRSDLKLVRCPRSLAPTLVILPSMSLIPFAPFGELGEGGWEVFSDFLSDNVGIGKIGAVFEGFVFEQGMPSYFACFLQAMIVSSDL